MKKISSPMGSTGHLVRTTSALHSAAACLCNIQPPARRLSLNLPRTILSPEQMSTLSRFRHFPDAWQQA